MKFAKLSVKISRFLQRSRTAARFLGLVSIGTLVLGVLAYPQIGAAQGFYGSITGTVTDNTGAVVLGATVNLTNSATGVKTQTATNGAGVYSFPNIQPGTYQLTSHSKRIQNHDSRIDRRPSCLKSKS
jgi:hypothetical protein